MPSQGNHPCATEQGSSSFIEPIADLSSLAYSRSGMNSMNGDEHGDVVWVQFQQRCGPVDTSTEHLQSRHSSQFKSSRRKSSNHYTSCEMVSSLILLNYHM